MAAASSLKIALANVALGVTGLIWLAGLARGRVRWRWSPLYLPVLGYVAASLAAAAFSPRPLFSLRELGDLLTLAVVPMTVTLMDRTLWERFLVVLAAVGSLSAVAAIWQTVRSGLDLSQRPHGLANHYMTFAEWSLLVTLLVVADLAFRRSRSDRRLLWMGSALLLCATSLALSQTRGVWIGLAAGLVLLAALRKPALLLVYPLLAVLLLVLMPRPLVARAASAFDLGQPSNSERLRMLAAGAAMVRSHPLFGVGLGMVKPSYAQYAPGSGRARVPHLHNNVMQVAAERGLLGVAAYLAILAVFFTHGFASLKRAGPEVAPAVAACLVAVAGLTVAGMFEYNWGDAEVWIPTLVCLAAPFALSGEVSP